MKQKPVSAIWAALLLSILALGILAYRQSQRPLEFYYDGHFYTHRQFATAPLKFTSLGELQEANLDTNPDARFLFTLSDHLNGEHLGKVLHEYVASGLGSSMWWRIKGGRATRYDFPSYSEDDPRNSLKSGAENPSLVKIPGSTACVLEISLREDEILLNDVPITLEDLSAIIQKTTQGVEIGLRYMMLRMPEETTLNSAKGLFDWIATQKWDYLLWIETPLDPTNHSVGEGGYRASDLRRKSDRYRYSFRTSPPSNPHFPESLPNAAGKAVLLNSK